MKKSISLLFTISTLCLTFSCELNQDASIETQDVELTKLNVIDKISNDDAFSELIQLFKDVNNSSIKSNIDLSIDNDEFQKLQNEEDVIQFIYQNYENPDEFLNKVSLISKQANKIKSRYILLTQFNEKEQEYIFTNALSNHLANISLSTSMINNNPLGECEAQYGVKKENCDDVALAEAVVCGLLSPTIGVALLCAVSTSWLNNICVQGAQGEYDVCKAYK